MHQSGWSKARWAHPKSLHFSMWANLTAIWEAVLDEWRTSRWFNEIPNNLKLRAVASMKQDEAIASSWFWPKIDFSEEKWHGKCLKEHFLASRFQHFLGGGRGGGECPQIPPSGSRLRHSKLASSCSEVWLRPWN